MKMKKPNKMTLRDRYKAPTPPFFKRISLWGKVLLALSTGVGTVAAIAAPPLAPVLLAAASVTGAIGTTAIAVAQATVDYPTDEPAKN